MRVRKAVCNLTSASQKPCDSLTSSPVLVRSRGERMIFSILKYTTGIALCWQSSYIHGYLRDQLDKNV